MTVAQAVEASFVHAAGRLPTLFALEDHAYELLALLEDITDPEDAAAIDSQLALIDQLMIEKSESYVSVIRSLEAMATARKAEADRLRERAKTAERNAEWLKNRLLVHMQVTHRERIETARFTLSVRQNPPSVVVADEPVLARVEAYETMPDVPPEYVRLITLYKLDKRAITAYTKATGEVVPGTSIERTTRLSIA